MKVFLDTNIFLEYFERRRQYQCALQNKCDALITINLKDFSRADSPVMEILSPEEFVGKYL